jgi:hypothetical protein
MAQECLKAAEASRPPVLPAPDAQLLDESASPHVLSLPAEVELHILSRLSAADLAACMATCRAWRQAAAAPELWRALSDARWRHGSRLGPTAQLQREGRWLEFYCERRKVRRSHNAKWAS